MGASGQGRAGHFLVREVACFLIAPFYLWRDAPEGFRGWGAARIVRSVHGSGFGAPIGSEGGFGTSKPATLRGGAIFGLGPFSGVVVFD